MSETTSTVSLGSITVTAEQAALLQAAVDSRGKDLPTLLSEGNTWSGLIQDQVNQSAGRLVAAGAIPADIVTEAKAYAAKQVAARGGVA
jgi:hypothetical protein